MPWRWIWQISFNSPMAVSINPRPARSSCLKAASGFCFLKPCDELNTLIAQCFCLYTTDLRIEGLSNIESVFRQRLDHLYY
ncbi:hypothetical protein midi_00494 [Candidatus Midichloria mitochondrii IricVA]|uniref:Uncharacterized protein n=1 Tax=Midichloria mitochondrii (strain IricVA) TaxID=696127 RepID=F7XVV2_MIDMI|nr:hypothetical protein midi_00494 [Candidatus Midichloria mitochondrii IricVA]